MKSLNCVTSAGKKKKAQLVNKNGNKYKHKPSAEQGILAYRTGAQQIYRQNQKKP